MCRRQIPCPEHTLLTGAFPILYEDAREAGCAAGADRYQLNSVKKSKMLHLVIAYINGCARMP